MKILVIQLARLGDIYQSWPTVAALKRTFPEAEVQLLVRKKFRSATIGLNCVDRVVELDTASILEPVIVGEGHVEMVRASQSRLSHFLKDLESENFDRIINLTFSPVSAYISEHLQKPSNVVLGYSRNADGTLRICGDAAAFFYAQVGTDRHSRIHLTHLFAQVAGVELSEHDFTGAQDFGGSLGNDSSRVGPIVLHIGASAAHKKIPLDKWRGIIKGLSQQKALFMVLVGGESERTEANLIAEGFDKTVINLVGSTELHELHELLSRAQMLIGPDSSVIHIASLTQTPTLNLSCGRVSYWETGPLATGSRVLRAEDPSTFIAEEIAAECLGLINGSPSARAVAICDGPLLGLRDVSNSPAHGDWPWIQSLYLGEEFPLVESSLVAEGLLSLRQANRVALEQIRRIDFLLKQKLPVDTAILQRLEEVVESVARLVPELRPLVNWYQTEKVRIQPGDIAVVLKSTEDVHLQFDRILSVYVDDQFLSQSLGEPLNENNASIT